MDIVLLILAVLCVLVGLLGCLLPVLPGPPVSYLGLLLMQWSDYAGYSTNFLVGWAVVMIVVTAADYFLPAFLAKRVGGSREATIGATVGIVAGIFLFPPIGMILCPFFGALIGELMHDRENSAKAFKVAIGSFVAFFLGTGIKLIASAMMAYYVIKEIVV